MPPYRRKRCGSIRRSFALADASAEDEEQSHSVWLLADTRNLKAAWPKDAPKYPTNIKVYEQSKRYQNLWTQNNGTFHGWRAEPIEDLESREFTLSGGMDDLHQATWRSTKAIALTGKIQVWRESTDVKAFSLVPRWRWRFPVATRTFDVLSNQDGAIFEIRSREKGTEGGWRSEVVWSDEKLAPKGFSGTKGKACITCHRTAGDVLNVPGRIYMRERWGSDQTFSFRPYDESGNLIPGLPLEVLGR